MTHKRENKSSWKKGKMEWAYQSNELNSFGDDVKANIVVLIEIILPPFEFVLPANTSSDPCCRHTCLIVLLFQLLLLSPPSSPPLLLFFSRKNNFFFLFSCAALIDAIGTYTIDIIQRCWTIHNTIWIWQQLIQSVKRPGNQNTI